MSTRPVIFISAVSRELHTARDLVAKTLLALGYEPKWQDIAATDTGDLRAVLRQWIDDSDAVLQLIGHCYGFAPTSPDPTFGPCSYTQYEALYARQKGKKVYYIFTDHNHPTDGCACHPKTLHKLQKKYRKTVKTYGDLYHSTSSLSQTELLVRRLKDDLAHLRKRGKQHAALVLVLLVVILLGVVWLKRDSFFQHQASTATLQKVDVLHEDNAKLLQALRDLPQTLSKEPRTDAKENEATQIARAYTLLEKQLKLSPGILVRELPLFAQQLLLRADTSALDRAKAFFVTQKFAEAEAEALKAKDNTLAAGRPAQEVIAALHLAGQCAQAQIHYPQAMEYYRAAAALTNPERDVLQWLELQNAISWLYYLQGRYPEGLAHSWRVWQSAQQYGKDEAPAVLAAHGHYASSLVYNGQASAAEPEHRAVLKVQERVLGKEHHRTLASRNNLASALYSQAKYAEAEQEQRAVLKIEERVLGSEHPSTLRSRMNLATALRAQGKPAEAEQEYQVVLQAQERVLGAEHPDTLSTRSDWAVVLNGQGKHVEAEQEQRALIKIKERVLGAEHPDTLTSRNNLAVALNDQGKYAEAEQEQREVLKIKERMLGAEHPDTLTSRMNLANAMDAQGKHAESEQEAVLKIKERMLGVEHPDTLTSRMNLANALQNKGMHAEAEQEYRAVVKIEERMLGPEHPGTLASRNNLAVALNAMGKHAEAEQEQRAVLKIRERVQDAEHPDVALSYYNLALCLEAQQKLPEALKLMQLAEQLRTKVLGSGHPDTKNAKTVHERIEATLK